MTISTTGRLESLLIDSHECVSHYASLFIATINGADVEASHIEARDNTLAVSFGTELHAKIAITTRNDYFLFDVISAGSGIDGLTFRLGVDRRDRMGWRMNATHDDEGVVHVFGGTANVYTSNEYTDDQFTMKCACDYRHGIEGASFVVIACPRKVYSACCEAAEKDLGLPCPTLDGVWARESDDIYSSYLFAQRITHEHIDALIGHAKAGGFGAILLDRHSWLQSAGHYEINQESFPEKTLRHAADKIHSAGLKIGLHLYGPSIATTDPYVTPTPDSRLAGVPCPQLQRPLSTTDTELMFVSKPSLPPYTTESRAFPGHYLQVEDEIVQYVPDSVNGSIYTNIKRGACGTTPAHHAKTADVKGLLCLWGQFLIDPDSSLVDEIAERFGAIIADNQIDMVYMDASDSISDEYIDGWYYLNRLHGSYWRHLNRDVLYQTSCGVGRDILWHMCPRAASGNGRDDIENYLDQKWGAILGQRDNMTTPDVGWYYWRDGIPVESLEYVATKAATIGSPISIEMWPASFELPDTPRLLTSVARWEKCKVANRKAGVY